MAASGDCVALIQAAMAKLGVQGRKSSTSALQQIERARALVQEARRLGGAGEEGEGQQHQLPLTLEHVQRVVDLYRESIEALSSVSEDRRHTQEVMAMLHAFLSQPTVQAVLEQAPPPPPPPTPSSSSSGSSSGVGAFMSRLSAVPKGLGLPPRKGPVLPRIDAALHAQEDDDGLAHEERNLLKHGLSRLKSLLEVGDGEGSARRRLGSRGSDAVGGLDLSVSGDSAASEEEAGGEVGAQGVDDSVGAVLEDLERTVAEATSAFEKLSSPEKPTELATQQAAHEEREEEGAAGPVSAATALQEEGGGKGKGEGATAEADEEEIVI